MRNHQKHITGIILAGGKSSRMGSDKALKTFKGNTFIEYSIEALKPLTKEIIIVSSNPKHDSFKLTRIQDEIEDAGPLAGLYSGLKHSSNSLNLVLSCDIPNINSVVLKKLIDAVEEQIDAILLKSQEQIMPLIGLYKKHCYKPCFDLLQNNERRMMRLMEELNIKTITLNKELEKHTVNINTKQDWIKLNEQ